MINYGNLAKYCEHNNGIINFTLVENFALAEADQTQIWHCHHRKEIDEGLTKQELIAKGLYYNRPPEELILLTPGEHISLHTKGKTGRCGEDNPMFGKHHSEESRQKISETRKDRIASGELVQDLSCLHNEEVYAKISKKAKERYEDPSNHPMFGKQHSEETKQKISEAKKGKQLTKNHKHHISESIKAAMNDEVKAKISNARKGKIWINNGAEARIIDPSMPIPDGWRRGRVA